MSSAASEKGTLFIVSTSHMDWDWLLTFEEYYKNGTEKDNSVRNILKTAFKLIQETPDYQFNLAEVAWLQRYSTENPLPPLNTLKDRFYFLGGGMTSPDNLVCNGEAFIRNYLVGRQYIKSIGLQSLMTDVCWIPDDFGQDSQLPIVLKAMGMTAVSFWRVPGNQPKQPVYVAQQGESMKDRLLKTPTFLWQAADHSTILTTQMWSGYGIIWNQASTSSDHLSNLNRFVANAKPFGNIFMAPCGGDFSVPSKLLLDTIAAYNKQSTAIPAQLGTFQNFVDAVNNHPDKLLTQSLDLSNYWTGHFSSQVQLKIDQQVTVNTLLAAETLEVLLEGLLPTTDLHSQINRSWDNLVPSTHHDYINGTAANHVYTKEQLPLSQTALDQSLQSLKLAMNLLGSIVKAEPLENEIPYVIFNPAGFQRSLGSLVEIPATLALKDVKSFRLPGQTTYYPVQIKKNSNLVFPFPGLQSFGYNCVYFSTTANYKPVSNPVTIKDEEFENALIKFKISSHHGWAITSIRDLQNNQEILTPGGLGNSIALYSERFDAQIVGNNYQMGQEFNQQASEIDKGFALDVHNPYLSKSGEIIENGPWISTFQGTVNNKQTGDTVIEYSLIYNEPIIRIAVTGKAVETDKAHINANTIVTSWDLNGSSNSLVYGTPNHWTASSVEPYWFGPLFCCTHDYLTFKNSAIYHLGMRAWATNKGLLQGILFRNAPGTNRGAKSLVDADTHTQRFAFRLPGVGKPESCQPLQESIAFQQPLLSIPASLKGNILPESSFLASLVESNALLRMARSQNSQSYVLRIYQPTNSTTDTYHLQMAGKVGKVSLVTALEDPLDQSAPIFNDGVVTIPKMPTLTTLQVFRL